MQTDSRPVVSRRRPSAPTPYASVCVGCGHLASRHLLVKGSPIEGPYACRDCGHHHFQGDATGALWREPDYLAWAEAHPGQTWDDEP